MQDKDCIRFLQWALPQIQMRWTGFRRVHKQVCKRLARRLTELELSDLDSYRQYLSSNHDEWPKLDSLCRVVVTRFYRDKRVFGELAERVLPQLAAAAQAAGRKILHAWSIGSASGEEAYNPPLDRDLSAKEYEAALQLADRYGLKRLDQRRARRWFPC